MSLDLAPPRPAAATRRPARRTASDHLRDALLHLAEHRGQILSHGEKAWASVTFAGARHSVVVLFAGEEAVSAGERFVAALPEHEFALPGRLVADATVTEVEHRMLPDPRMVVTCEVLLLDDA